MVDLHMHSTFSDGSLTPEQLAERGQAEGLAAMALTDHDSTDGVERFVAACTRSGILGIPGVEISLDVGKGTMHMLGYFVQPGHPALEDVLRRIRAGRETRNQGILEALNRLGMPLTWDEVASRAGEDVVGRPHFAMALVARQYVASKGEAFERFLAKGRPAYLDRYRLSPAESIAAIAGAGGLAVLSHPHTLDLGRKSLRACVTELAGHGLQGIEVYYSEHTPEQTRQYLALARELGLAATGGSDFHGEMNPSIRIGRGFGTLAVPDEAVAELRARQRKAG